MSASPIQFSLPFYSGEGSEEKADCVHYAKIAAFAISIILLIAGILVLTGAFGSVRGEIGWPLVALGIVGLAISCVRNSHDPSATNDPDATIMSTTRQADTSFSNRGSQSSDKQAVINRVMSEPDSFKDLNYDLRNDEDVVVAALNGCKSPEQAKKVMSNANFNAKNSQKVALVLVKIDPTQLGQLNYDAKNDPDVVVAALNGCKSPEQAKKVMSSANYDAKNSKKVGLALVQIDPTQLGQLNYDAKNNEDVVVAALGGCRSPEQAKQVISSANYDAKNSKKVALALVKIDPMLLGQLSYDAKNDLNVVLLAIKLSTEDTINKIWGSIGINAALNPEIRAKVKEKYPNFFQDRTSQNAFPNIFQHGIFQGFPLALNTQNIPNQTPQVAVQTKWVEPDDLKGNTSDGANTARQILKQNHLLATHLALPIDLTKINVSKEMAKYILCKLLELDEGILDKDLKKAYQKAVMVIHPDKFKLASGEEAFKALTAAYSQAAL